MKLSELPQSSPKIFVYSEIGGGKTALGLTLGARCQVADLEAGLTTGLKVQDNFTADRLATDIRLFRDDDASRPGTLWPKFKAYVYGLPKEIRDKTWNFDALFVDSFSACVESATDMIMSNSGMIGKNPEIQHWGLAFNEVKNVFDILISLPVVLLVSGHEEIKTIPKGKSVSTAGKEKEDVEYRLGVATPGKNLASQILRKFDEVWYMRARPAGGGKFEYVVQTSKDAVIAAKSRGCLPNMTNTNIGMWKLVEMLGYVPKERK